MINATGVLLHTNLGRAPLSGAARTPWPPRQAAPTWNLIWLPGSAGGAAGAGNRGGRSAGSAGGGLGDQPGAGGHAGWPAAEAVAAHAAADPLAAGLPAGAAQAALGLPDRRLAEALIRPPLTLRDGAIRPASTGPDGAGTAGAAGPAFPETVTRYQDRADGPGSASGTAPSPHGGAAAGGRLEEAGLSSRAVAAAARAGLLLRFSDQIVLAPGAAEQAAGILAGLPQPFTTAEARKALGSPGGW